MDEPLYVSRTLAPLLGYEVSPLDYFQNRRHPAILSFWQTISHLLQFDFSVRSFIIKHYGTDMIHYCLYISKKEAKTVPFRIDDVFEHIGPF